MKRFAVNLLTMIIVAVHVAVQPLEIRPVLAADGPKISVTPNTGGMKTQVTVSGQGFPAGQNIAVYLGVANAGFGGTTYAQATSDNSGAFSAAFALPGTWPNGDPILETSLAVVAATADGAVKASAEFAFTPAPLDALGWKPYTNAKFGFRLMLPPGWDATDQGDLIDLRASAGEIKLTLTPATLIGNASLGGMPVFAMSVEDYARLAIPIEQGGDNANAGTFTLQEIHPFTTRAGQPGSLAIWLTSGTSTQDSAASSATLVAAYLDLNKIVDGKYYRALELSTILAAQPTIGTFDAIFGSLAVQQPVNVQDQAGIELAVKAAITTNAPYRVLVERTAAESSAGSVARIVILTQAGNTTGFVRLQNGKWSVLGIGNNLDSSFFQKNAIPSSLQTD